MQHSQGVVPRESWHGAWYCTVGQTVQFALCPRKSSLKKQGKLHSLPYIFRRRAYANTAARPALRRANVDEEPRLHVGRRHNAGDGDRRDDGDFQRSQCDTAASAAVSAARTPGAILGQQAAYEHAAIAALAAEFQ